MDLTSQDMLDTSRRQKLIERMDQLIGLNMSCHGCSGTCCTFEANSMMITPLEALEILTYLKNNKLLTADLKSRVESAAVKYRLEHNFGNGKKSYLRKTYTCPFFNHQELGCPLPREVKPYGCLAFNPHHESIKASSDCFSEKELLTERENDHQIETKLNEDLRKTLNLHWNKSPIPTALLDIWEKI